MRLSSFRAYAGGIPGPQTDKTEMDAVSRRCRRRCRWRASELRKSESGPGDAGNRMEPAPGIPPSACGVAVGTRRAVGLGRTPCNGDRASTRPPRWSRPDQPAVRPARDRGDHRPVHRGPEQLAVADLTHLRTGRGPHDRRRRRVVAFAAVGAARPACCSVSPAGWTGYRRGVPGAGCGVPAARAAGAARGPLAATGPRTARPLPRHRAAAVQRRDDRQFGQVTRSLLRAREVNRYGSWVDPLAEADPWRPNR